jgi:two-component system, OmpR family, sensor histidine kinase KdpD
MNGVQQGRLRLYLGAAAGVGTTFAMLDEAIRRRNRGTRVALGWVDAHNRPFTKALLTELLGESEPPSRLDIARLIAENPDVVMVDELGRHDESIEGTGFHWNGVEQLLDAGISVVGTINIGDLASVAPRVNEILGTSLNGTVPERFLKRAEQIELVDITPEAIRRRVAHGNVFTPTELQPREADFFNTEAFARLRSLTIDWLANRLRGQLPDSAEREKIVVLLDGVDDAATMSRAASIAQHSRAEILGLHVADTQLTHEDTMRERQRRIVEDAGGSYHEIEGAEIGETLLAFADAHGATHVVTGSPGANRRWHRRSLADIILPETGISRRRRLWGVVVGMVVLAGVTGLLVANRDNVSVPTSLAIYLLAVVGITAVGGRVPGIISAVIAPLLANWYLIPPFHTFRINDGENLLELVVFISAATIVSSFVAIAANRAADAENARREARILAEVQQTGNNDPVDGVLSAMTNIFGLTGALILDERPDAREPTITSGPVPPHHVSDATFATGVSPGVTLAVNGPPLSAADHRLFVMLIGQLSVALEQRALREIATEAEALAKADELRTAILRAVSHDLRSPLASIKASVSSLRQTDVNWEEADRQEFLSSIESETDRLTGIITNLLDLSRLEAGVLQPVLRAVSLDEILPSVLRSINSPSRVTTTVELGLPDFLADPALLERVLANLLDNAVSWSPENEPVTVSAFRKDGDLHIHIIDNGRGIPENDRQLVVQPFHRLNDSAVHGGLGLGLAIADRLVAAMGGRLELRDTPCGGLTAVVILPTVENLA